MGAPARKRRRRRTKAVPSTPAKGRMNQHMADAPYGARSKHCIHAQEPFGSGWRF